MPYDPALAERVRALLKRRRGISERKMFGGIAFLLRGNMLCGVSERNLVVRVGRDAYERSLTRPHARPMDLTGRPLRGLVYVEPQGVRTEGALRSWIERGLDFTRTLPPR